MFAHLRPIRHICRVCFAKRNKPDANQCVAPGESYGLISKADMLFPLYSNDTQTNTNMHWHWQRIWLNTHRLTRNAHFSKEALTKIRVVFSDSLAWCEFISWSSAVRASTGDEYVCFLLSQEGEKVQSFIPLCVCCVCECFSPILDKKSRESNCSFVSPCSVITLFV